MKIRRKKRPIRAANRDRRTAANAPLFARTYGIAHQPFHFVIKLDVASFRATAQEYVRDELRQRYVGELVSSPRIRERFDHG
jgi:hypothetical protein